MTNAASTTVAAPGRPPGFVSSRAGLAAGVLGLAVKARRARGSRDVLDHADVLAAAASLAVLVVRTRRPGGARRAVEGPVGVRGDTRPM